MFISEVDVGTFEKEKKKQFLYIHSHTHTGKVFHVRILYILFFFVCTKYKNIYKY